MKRWVLLPAFIALSASLSGCDQCAGTPSCRSTPEISYSGQFIERQSGAPVAGVSVTFVRESGVEFAYATPSTLSDADGFFVLRAPALQEGFASGDLRVVPPPPHVPYTIADVSLQTNRVRGSGGNFGRLVVNPYLFLVGHVRDRKTHTPLPGAQVMMRRLGGGRVEVDSMAFVTDPGGQFGWEPRVIDPAPIEASFEISASGYSRPHVIRRNLFLAYRDLDMMFVILPVGWGLSYSGGTVRRGSYEAIPGVTVEFRRIAGINTQPEQTNLPVDSRGGFPIAVEPLAEGSLIAELRILPPSPFPPETSRVEMQTTDDDEVQTLGFFRFGAQLFLNAELREADSGQPLPQGTVVAVNRISGPALDWTAPPADSGLRSLDAQGKFTYQAPMADSGLAQLQLIVRLPPPFVWDTISPVTVSARYSDSSLVVGPLSVRRRPRP